MKIVFVIVSAFAFASCDINRSAVDETSVNKIQDCTSICDSVLVQNSITSIEDWDENSNFATIDACHTMEVELIRESILEEFGSYANMYKYLRDNLYKSELTVCGHTVDYCDDTFDFVDYTDARGAKVHLYEVINL